MRMRSPNKALKKPGGETATLSQWQLIRLRFMNHKLAALALVLLVFLYALAIFAGFFAPYSREWSNLSHAYAPPQPVRLSLQGPYVYPVERSIDPVTLRKTYVEDRSRRIPLSFFVKGESYRIMGMIPSSRHFIGIDREEYHARFGHPMPLGTPEEPTFYLLGADGYGHDLLTHIIFGARVSLSIGLVGIMFTLVIGVFLGGISGYLGGSVDIVIQRIIEILNSFPHLPLWLAIAAVLPPDWSPLAVYFAITIILSLLNWTGLARSVRGKILSLREEDYAMAARLLGASHGRILFRHLVPGFTSHILVRLTLAFPYMILAETSLSFLGLGLRPPIISWGVMLQDTMNITAVANYPWLLMPVLFIVVTVLSFNFLGDGLRDAADPYG